MVLSEPPIQRSVLYQHKALARVIDEVLRSPCGTTRVTAVARSAGFSRFHLTRLFHKGTHETLTQFLTRVRLERGAFMLRHSRDTVRVIAAISGYRSQEAFSRAFKRAYGCLPTVFRNGTQDWPLPAKSGLHWNPDWIRISSKTRWGDSVVFCERRFACVWRTVRSYSELDASWLLLAQEFEREIPEKATFVTLYLDNLWTHPESNTMRADIGWLCDGSDIAPPGMRIVTIPPGNYAISRFVGRADRHNLWSYMTGRYGSEKGRGSKPRSYDEYDRLPIPFQDAQTRAFVASGRSSVVAC